jgi:site-specific DNA recombinase
MKSIILARVSTDDQNTDPQMARAIEYRDRNDKLEKWLEFEFDESSTIDQRKKFQVVVEEIKKSKEPVALIVETIDRLQRGFTESVLLEEYRKSGKLDLHFIRENLVLNKDSNSADLLRWDMGVMFARSYVLQLSDNVKRTRQRQLENGQWPHNAPIGYINTGVDDEVRDIVPDDDRAHLIVYAFEKYAAGGYSLQMLAKDLQAKGLNNRISGKLVGKAQLDLILKNPFYYGVMVCKDQHYPHKYKPLIPKSLYDKCVEVRMGRSKSKYKYAGKPFAFRGLIKCGYCGCSVCSDRKKDKYTYLNCNQYKGKCGSIRIREEVVTEQILNIFKSFRIPEDAKKRVLDKMNVSFIHEREFYKKSSDDIVREIREIDQKIDEMYQDKLCRRITAEQYDKYVIESKAKQDDLNSQLKDHIKADKTFLLTSSMIMELANRAPELYQNSKEDQKRRLVDFLLSNLRLEGKKLMWDYKKPFGFMALCTTHQEWLRRSDSNRQHPR